MEAQRKKNIEDNLRVLSSIGLSKICPKTSKVTFKKLLTHAITPEPKPAHSCKRKLVIDNEELGSIRKGIRRSARIQGKEADAAELDDTDSGNEEIGLHKKVYRPNVYGAIEGVDVGTTWMMRLDCSRDGIHRPTVAGIHGGPEGAYSIALSGGYDDNIDLGEGFTYTGEGGRDLKGTKANPKNLRTAPQSKDQTLTRGNLALSRNVETKHPVRVIRGYKLDSPFAPEDGYRYDGLYSVEKSWFTTGLSGFGVWKFALKRCPNQAPPPWTLESSSDGDSTDKEITEQKAYLKEEEKADISNSVQDMTSSLKNPMVGIDHSSQKNMKNAIVKDTGKLEQMKSTDEMKQKSSKTETPVEVNKDEMNAVLCNNGCHANKENEQIW